ncbi:MAG TPA: hypothetical protein VKN99_26160 [Polyangia bacterium]|nr:hypothetical protein [Polyangia bacterium]
MIASICFILGCGDDSAQSDAALVPDASAADAHVAALPDLRFKWIDAFPKFSLNVCTNVLCGSNTHHDQFAWIPVGMGSGDATDAQLDAGPLPSDSWISADFTPTAQIENMTSVLLVGRPGMMQSTLDDLFAQHLVITSLDTSDDHFFGSTASGPTGGSEYADHRIFMGARAQLDAWATSEGTSGRVITAVTSDRALVQAYSFGRSGDTSTYETRLADATFDNLAAQASMLASEGYFLTAFGRVNPEPFAGPFVLVGTRPSGATSPRTARTQAVTTTSYCSAIAADLQDGFAIVGWAFDINDRYFIISER